MRKTFRFFTSMLAAPRAPADKSGTKEVVTVELQSSGTVKSQHAHKLHLPAGAVARTDAVISSGEMRAGSAGGVFHVWSTDKNGKVEWDVYVHNSLANDGANYLRDMFFKANATTLIANAPVVGLLTATPTATTTLATMTEATGGGYARKTVTWTCSTTGSCNNTASAASWTASGTSINAVTYLFVTDATTGTTGKFMAFALLTGGPYTVNVGSTLNVTYTWTVA